MTNIFIETERLYIRTLDDSDYDLVKQIYDEDSFVKNQKNSPLLYDCLVKTHWDEVTLSNTINGMIFEKATNDFCGRVCMQRTDAEYPEIGIELLTAKRNKKIGPESVIAFANWYYKTYGVQNIHVRIEEDNMHSRHIFEKLGAIYKGRVPYVSESVIRKMEESLSDFKREEFEQRGPLLLSLELPI